MDRIYINPSEESLHKAMAQYAAWLTDKLASVDQNVDKQDSMVG
jgi:hypothetical protein